MVLVPKKETSFQISMKKISDLARKVLGNGNLSKKRMSESSVFRISSKCDKEIRIGGIGRF